MLYAYGRFFGQEAALLLDFCNKNTASDIERNRK